MGRRRWRSRLRPVDLLAVGTYGLRGRKGRAALTAVGIALLFVPAWGTFLLIVVIASSTASIIGVGELVSRSNSVVNAVSDPGLLLPVYLLAMLVFFAFCYPLVALLERLRRGLVRRYGVAGPR